MRNFRSFMSFTLAVLLAFVMLAPAASAATAVKDAELQRALDDAFVEDLKEVEELWIDGYEYDIKDLSGLEKASNLQYFALTGTSGLSDISEISGYKNLKQLDLSYNNISNINALSTVKFTGSYNALYLEGNKISNLSPLKTLTVPSDVYRFEVSLNGNALKSLDGIEELTSITDLYANLNKISNADVIENLTNLHTLDLSYNKLTELPNLSKLTELTSLSVYNNQLRVLSGLNVQKDVYYFLDLSYNELNSVSSLTGITSGIIDLTHNNITDISALKDLKHGTVILTGNKLNSSSKAIIDTLKKRGVTVEHDTIAAAPANKTTPESPRVKGASRYDTAVEISKRGWANNSTDTVIIARGDSFPDALSGSPLAYQENAPILLTEKGKLTNVNISEIKRLGATKAIILGGTGAVSKQVEADLKKNGIKKVERISGIDRYETAKKIAEKLDGNPKTAVVAYGLNFPDALAAASYAAINGYPILLTDKDRLPSYTSELLKSQGIKDTIVVGGTGVISEKVKKALPSAERISGINRYATAANFLAKGKTTTKAYVTSGTNFADALTGSVLAAKEGASLILVDPKNLPTETAKAVQKYEFSEFIVLGGTGAIADKVILGLEK